MGDSLEVRSSVLRCRDSADWQVVEMEAEFCSVALDIIGKSVFNYDFGSVANESPVIKAVYNTLREAEHRSTFYFPYWNIPGASMVVPRQRRFQVLPPYPLAFTKVRAKRAQWRDNPAR